MKRIRCMFCQKETAIHKINVQKKINNKVVTITNAPVYFCADCDETFLAKETQDVFNYIRERSLEGGRILFRFDEMIKKIY